MLKDLFAGIIGIIYPPKCVFCSKLLSYPQLECTDCVKLRDQSICPICGLTYPKCTCHFAFEKVLSPFEYSGRVKSAILKLKTKPNASTSKVFANYMAEIYKITQDNLDNTLVVPVPTSDYIEKSRGFNQAKLLAEQICIILNLPLNDDILTRKNDSLTQHNLDYMQRIHNANNSFIIKYPVNLSGLNILLIDDISTTGSTLNACSIALMNLGAKKVTALCASSTYNKRY